MAVTGPDAAQALAIDANALSQLRREAHASPERALAKAAGQFEALFLQMVLKQMRETLPKDGPLDSDAMRTYTSMFDQQIAQHLSSRGLGLREAIERQLGRALQPKGAAAPGAGAAPAGTAPGPQGEAQGPSARDAWRRAGATAAPPLPTHAAATPRAPAAAERVQAFVERLRPQAEAAAAASGIPAHLLIAQAGLETGWGRSQPRHADGTASHNLFGIKATGRWRGASVAATTTEFVQGAAVRTVERFRAYRSAGEAFRDFAQVLGADRYASARASARANDAAGYARGLQQAGYATDPQYAEKLGRAIRMVAQHLAGRPAAATAGLAAAPSAPSGVDKVQVFAAAADIPVEPSTL
jgi:flagellar protein FlgJ